jgi:hypothetical protein
MIKLRYALPLASVLLMLLALVVRRVVKAPMPFLRCYGAGPRLVREGHAQ